MEMYEISTATDEELEKRNIQLSYTAGRWNLTQKASDEWNAIQLEIEARLNAVGKTSKSSVDKTYSK